jgi:hypothetical protein
MIQRIIEDIKLSIGSGLRQTSLAAMAALALFVTTCFLCAAAFVAVLDRYGPIEACLAGAGLFFIVALIAAGTYMVRKRQIERQAKERAKSATKAMLADPMVVAAGLQVVRAIGVKRLIPILAVGGLALGLLAGRNSAAGDQAPAE